MPYCRRNFLPAERREQRLWGRFHISLEDRLDDGQNLERPAEVSEQLRFRDAVRSPRARLFAGETLQEEPAVRAQHAVYRPDVDRPLVLRQDVEHPAVHNHIDQIRRESRVEDVVDEERDREARLFRGCLRLLDRAPRYVCRNDVEAALREVHRLRRRACAEVEETSAAEAVGLQGTLDVRVQVGVVPRERGNVRGREQYLPIARWPGRPRRLHHAAATTGVGYGALPVRRAPWGV